MFDVPDSCLLACIFAPMYANPPKSTQVPCGAPAPCLRNNFKGLEEGNLRVRLIVKGFSLVPFGSGSTQRRLITRVCSTQALTQQSPPKGPRGLRTIHIINRIIHILQPGGSSPYAEGFKDKYCAQACMEPLDTMFGLFTSMLVVFYVLLYTCMCGVGIHSCLGDVP